MVPPRFRTCPPAGPTVKDAEGALFMLALVSAVVLALSLRQASASHDALLAADARNAALRHDRRGELKVASPGLVLSGLLGASFAAVALSAGAVTYLSLCLTGLRQDEAAFRRWLKGFQALLLGGYTFLFASVFLALWTARQAAELFSPRYALRYWTPGRATQRNGKANAVYDPASGEMRTMDRADFAKFRLGLTAAVATRVFSLFLFLWVAIVIAAAALHVYLRSTRPADDPAGSPSREGHGTSAAAATKALGSPLSLPRNSRRAPSLPRELLMQQATILERHLEITEAALAIIEQAEEPTPPQCGFAAIPPRPARP